MTERLSERVQEAWQESAQKFDYFMAGLVTAVTAYVGKTYRPGPLGWNPDALEFLALLAFVGSAIAAFKRIETFNTVLKVNIGQLRAHETASGLEDAVAEGLDIVIRGEGTRREDVVRAAENWRASATSLEGTARSLGGNAERWYHLRNTLLVAGMLIFAAARIWAGYHGCPPTRR